MNPKSLSGLEESVMNIVWELKECSVRDVRERMNKIKPRAYTTVATIFQRLHDKGLVNKKLVGSSFLYSPKLTKGAYSKSLAKSFINRFFTSFGDAAISSFAESIDSLPKTKKEYLLKLLEDYDKTK